MKRILFLSLVLLAAASLPTDACTNLIVGKAASVDGSVICTYNCDGFGFAGALLHTPAMRHEPGEMRPIRPWGMRVTGYIPEVEYTHGVIGYINDRQLSIVETTFDGRKELENREGLLDYDTMIHLGLERAATAREAIRIMTGLVQEYGYNSTGESITVCDKEEAWILEIIGKGPGRKGAVWVAVRIPDDCISAHANLCRIRQFPQARKADKKLGFCVVEGESMYSADVISFAREMGYFDGADEDFSFRDAYCPITFESVRYADARVWSFFRHHADKEEMDRYLPYINGDFAACDHLPLWIKPETKLSVRDVMADMRDHFEGTPLDMTADMSAGPWGMPIRPLPMSWEDAEGRKYFRERPIATQQTGFTLVSQLRGWLPDVVGGILYFNCDDAGMIAYVPVFCCTSEVPAPFARRNNPHHEFNPDGAFWMCNLVSNIVYPRYSVMAPDLREAQDELEDFYAADLPATDSAALALTPLERTEFLTRKSADYADIMMSRWDRLFKLLVVKHNDQIVKPSKDGAVVPGRYSTPGYDRRFYEAIGRGTGQRYRLRDSSDVRALNDLNENL